MNATTVKAVTLKAWTFYSDPGHSWLKVARKDVVAAGVADKVSVCSFQRGDYVYLEEDCDAEAFLVAVQAIGGYDWSTIKDTLKEKSTDRRSKIRSYQSYRA